MEDPPAYAGKSDEDIVRLAQRGDGGAAELIVERYGMAVRAMAGKYYLLGADDDDLSQEGFIGLFKAVCEYDPARSASFKAFALMCVKRQMLTAITRSLRQKSMPLMDYVPIDAGDARPQDDGARWGPTPVEPYEESPEDVLIGRESLHAINDLLNHSLSGYEREVLYLHSRGETAAEIGARMGRPAKSVGNALQRVRKKAVGVLKAMPS
ncbi:MAG: sigma-70 family RNA polymerase sigma factor [Oscillospiraceae bacterium]|nr:sigma-70 family RNA polymerase sigma factor [Oscillospiraceae bacterium]